MTTRCFLEIEPECLGIDPENAVRNFYSFAWRQNGDRLTVCFNDVFKVGTKLASNLAGQRAALHVSERAEHLRCGRNNVSKERTTQNQIGAQVTRSRSRGRPEGDRQ